ncbi:HPF/RaiA family ribosome-associated protein [Rhodovulum sp.]|uniref:HPF/RaiA family ribosome-associated protein n=1 Tax=Rhodovulum sp. TaxID=34009 RepID=UPI00178DF3B6|nr:HPF/RaiA family ribosome-associated protein [Rhodovulum sp.]HDR29252.1 HPF/RaiA family ribosome-associated protein [Rhodovulum sp.]
MQFQLNTDSNIHGDERLAEVAEQMVTSGLGHLTGRLTRVEVHLVDTNGAKGGPDDIRCTIEARPEGLRPHTVTHNDANVEAALRGGARKMRAHLESEFGKLDPRR